MNKVGMTVGELLIVIAILMIVLVTVSPLYNNIRVVANINEDTAQTIQAIRLARERAVAGFHAQRQGIYLEHNSASDDRYIVYVGNSYSARDTAYDRITTLSTGINFSFDGFSLDSNNNVDINFATTFGVPNNTGTITLTHNSGKEKSISINSLGMIQQE